MSDSINSPSVAGHLAVSGEFTIYTAGEWRERLLTAVTGQAEVSLDLSEVSEIDTAGLQLLIATQREVHAAGGTLHLAGPSAAVREVLSFCHLNDFFGLGAGEQAGEPS